LVFGQVVVLVLLLLMLMVVVEIHEHLGEQNLVLLMKVLMLRLMDDCVLIEGQELMNHYVLNQKELLFRLMNDLIQCSMEQTLLELVLPVLCVSSQTFDLYYQLLVENVGVRHLVRFVYFLIGRFVELVAFLVVAFVLQGLAVPPQLMPQQQQ
jgi:hypothetical protein